MGEIIVNRSSRQPRWHLLLALVAVLSLIAAACGDSSGGGDGETSSADGNSGDTEANEDDGDDGEANNSGDDGDGDGDDGDGDDGGEADGDTGVAADAGGTDAGVGDFSGGDPVVGGTLRVGVEAETDGLNPSNNAFAVSATQMANAVFDPLARIDADGNVIPYLAESFTPNDDFTQWTVKLREGITFHDGEPLTSEAIVKSVEATLGSLLVRWAIVPTLNENPGPAVEVIDDLTVQFNLDVPMVGWPRSVTAQLGYAASPAWLDAIAEDEGQAQFPVGTGPFVFDSRRQDEVTRFVRNDDWWGTEAFGQEVYLDAVEFVPLPDGEVRLEQFRSGDLDTVHTTTASQIKAYAELAAEGNAVNIIEDTGEESFVMINTDPNGGGEGANPFVDVRAREALTLATLREEYIEAIGEGILTPANSMFHPSQSEWYNPDIVQAANDPEGAIALAAEFCADQPAFCTDNKINMKFKYVGGSAIQDTIFRLLSAGWSVAFNVEEDTVLQDDYITQVATNDFQVVTWRQFGNADPDIDMLWLQCEAIAPISLNWPRFCNEDRDALMIEQRALADQGERKLLWDQITQNVNETFSYVFLTHTKWTNAFQPNVKGVCGEVGPGGVEMRCFRNGSHRFANIWLE